VVSAWIVTYAHPASSMTGGEMVTSAALIVAAWRPTRVRSEMLTLAFPDRASTINVVCSRERPLLPGSAPAVGRTVTSAHCDMLSMPFCQNCDQSRARRWNRRLVSLAASTLL
jgi:hypothetical protein